MASAGRITLDLDQAALKKIGVDYAYRLVLDGTRRTFNRANVLTPVDTGNLRSHNQMTAKRQPPGAVGWVYNTAEYADVVHDGSGPYIIRPKARRTRTGRPPMLKFEVNGRTVYARQVRHPGTKGRPWMARAGREVAAQTGFTWSPG